MAKKNLSSIRPRGILGDVQWSLPAKFLTKNNESIDSREILENAGFTILVPEPKPNPTSDLQALLRKSLPHSVDKRYKVIPPKNWSQYPTSEPGCIEIYDHHSDCIFVSISEVALYPSTPSYLKDADEVDDE